MFSLYPVFSILVLEMYRKQQTKSGMILAGLFTIGAVILLPFELIHFGLAYALFYGSLCVFPLLLERENLGKRKEQQLYRKILNKKKDEIENLIRHLSFRSKQLSLEMEKVLERYNFARVLVAQAEEEPIFLSLLKTFQNDKNVKGITFLSLPQEQILSEQKIGQLTVPAFSDASYQQLVGKHPELSELAVSLSSPVQQSLGKGKEGTQFLLSIPVNWGGTARGVLLFLLERSADARFLGEVSRYAQFLGLGFQKAELYRTMIERSRRDGLTLLYLRRIFLERLNEEIALSKRYGTSFSLLMLDLDYFKSVNDTYGHLAGDAVLQEVSAALRETLHPGAMICRYGGEEFAIIIGLAPQEVVRRIAENLCQQIAKREIAIQEGKSIRTTVSIGVAHYLPDAPPPAELLRRADMALYQAKEGGRNCVKEWQPERQG